MATTLTRTGRSAEPLPRLMTPKALGEHLGLSEGTLANWRSAGRGPKYVRAGGRVRYPEDEVVRWLRSARSV